MIMYTGVRKPQTGQSAMIAVKNIITPASVMAGIRLGKSASKSTVLPRVNGAIVDV